MSGIGTLLSGKNSAGSLLSQLNAAPSAKIIATPSSMSPAELATFNKTYIAGDGHGSSLHSSVKGGVRDVWITISPDHPNRSAFETPQYQVDMSGRHFWGSSGPQYIHHNKGNIDNARHLGLILGYASTTGEMYNTYVKGYVSTLPDNASAVKAGYDLLDMAKTLQASGDTQAAARVLVFAERVMGEQVTLLEGATAGLGDLVDGAKALAERGAAMVVLTNPVVYAASSAETQAWARETALAPVDMRAAFVPVAKAIDAAILDNNFAPTMRLAASGGGAGLAGKLGKITAVGVAARLEGRVDNLTKADGKITETFDQLPLHEPGADFAGRGIQRPDWLNHMEQASKSGKQISGGHNADNFHALLKQEGGTVVSSKSAGNGITRVEYKLPNHNPAKDPFTKTIYDPAVYPNMAEQAQTASHRILREYHANPSKAEHLVIVDGIKFDGAVRYVDGKATVLTVYPSGAVK
jgi:hypothetical protein